MSRKSFALKFDFRLAIVLIVYIILGASLVGYYQYQINPDGISYISVAQKYLDGDFKNAINGYWGPLYSWLLIPSLYFGVEPLLAAKLVSLAIGVATIIGLWVLSRRFEMPAGVRTTILVTSIPVMLSLAFSDITPDLLLTCILLFYLSIIFRADYTAGTKKGVVCGALGGIAYLSKSFAFPFFISHFFLMNVLVFLRSETREAKKNVVHNFLAGAVVFGVISGVWIGLISNKYGELTFGTAGKTAYKFRAAPGTLGNVYLEEGFSEPPNETALSIWEDPSYLKVPVSEPVVFGVFVKNQLQVTTGLIGKEAGIFMAFSPLTIAIGIAYLLLWLRRFSVKAIESEVLYPTATILLYAGGYSLVYVLARHLWPLCILLMLLGGYVLGRLFESNFFTKTRRWALLVVFFLSFAVPASQQLRVYTHRGELIHRLSEVLKSRIGPGDKIVSNRSWAGTLFLSYHLGCRYYGAQKKDINRTKLERQLEEYEIDYYLAWGGGVTDLGLLSNYREITGGRIPGLGIYSLKKRR
jgi:hypothetical protein